MKKAKKKKSKEEKELNSIKMLRDMLANDVDFTLLLVRVMLVVWPFFGSSLSKNGEIQIGAVIGLLIRIGVVILMFVALNRASKVLRAVDDYLYWRMNKVAEKDMDKAMRAAKEEEAGTKGKKKRHREGFSEEDLLLLQNKITEKLHKLKDRADAHAGSADYVCGRLRELRKQVSTMRDLRKLLDEFLEKEDGKNVMPADLLGVIERSIKTVVTRVNTVYDYLEIYPKDRESEEVNREVTQEMGANQVDLEHLDTLLLEMRKYVLKKKQGETGEVSVELEAYIKALQDVAEMR